jgi:FixJ family two-component response regulator
LATGDKSLADNSKPPLESRSYLALPERGFGFRLPMDVFMSIQGISVALIDDDELLRESLGDLLELAGLVVEQYASGEAFVAAAAQSKAACLIVDIQLGDMTGIEMVRHLSASDLYFPVIFMTGSTDAVFEGQADEVGCAAFLRKPFRRDMLIEAIMVATKLHSDVKGP